MSNEIFTRRHTIYPEQAIHSYLEREIHPMFRNISILCFVVGLTILAVAGVSVVSETALAHGSNGDITVSVANSTISGDRKTTYTVTVTNTGSNRTTFTVEALDDGVPNGWNVTDNEPLDGGNNYKQLTLDAGNSGSVEFTVTPDGDSETGAVSFGLWHQIEEDCGILCTNTDPKGHWIGSDFDTVTVDGSPPTISDPRANIEGTEVTFRAEVSDETGVSSVEVVTFPNALFRGETIEMVLPPPLPGSSGDTYTATKTFDRGTNFSYAIRAEDSLEQTNTKGAFEGAVPASDPPEFDVSQNPGSATAAPGETISFNTTIRNAPPDINSLGLDVYLPDGATIVSQSAPGATYSDGTNQWLWFSPSDPTSSFQVAYTVKFPENATPGEYDITARANYDDGTIVWSNTTTPVTVEESTVQAEISTIDQPSGTYSPGETVTATATVENTGSAKHTFFLGYSTRGPSGNLYDNGNETGTSVTLSSGESREVGLSWTVQDDSPAGEYDAITSVWEENDRSALVTRLDRATRIGVFTVQNNPATIAPFGDTTPLARSQTTPNSLAGKIRVEPAVANGTAVEVLRESSTNYSLAITAPDDATNVTFYLQREAISASQDIRDLTMYLDGEEHPFEVDESAGPGASPWVAFNIPHFSTRTVTFSSGSSLPDLAIDGVSWSPSDPVDGDPVSFSATIVNQGTAGASGFGVELSVGDDVLTADSIDLAAGETKTIDLSSWSAVDGTYDVSVMVDDANTVSESDETNNGDTTSISVATVNQAPTADAGFSETVRGGDAAELDGTGSSDPDGDSLSYSWTQTGGDSVSLSGSDTATPDFTAPDVETTETLTFELTVSDGNGGTDTDTVSITVEPLNEPPSADAGGSQTVQGREVVELDGTGSSDPDGDSLSYSWTQTGGDSVSLSGSDTATPDFTAPDVETTETFTFELTVSDGNGGSNTDTISVTVQDANDPPVAEAGPDQTASEGDVVTLEGSGSTDPDDDALSYSWSQIGGSPVSLTDPNTATPTFTVPEISSAEIITFELSVADTNGGSDTDTVSITVEPVNDPPAADAGSDQTVKEGDSVSLDAGGSSDPDGDSLSYSWSQTDGPSVSLSGSKSETASFTAPTVDTTTTLMLELSVSDGNGGSDTDTVSITVEPTNDDPTADAGPDQTVQGGDSVTLDASGSADPDDDSLSYSWSQSSGPSVSLSGSETQTPSFTAPDVDTTQSLTFELTVSDGNGGSDTDTLSITVEPTNDAPTADAGPDQTVEEGGSITLDASGSSDPDGDSLSYSWEVVSNVDPGVTIDGTETAMPTVTAPSVEQENTVELQVTVTDSEGASDSDTVDLTITPNTTATPTPGGTQPPPSTITTTIPATVIAQESARVDGSEVRFRNVSLSAITFTENAGATNGTIRVRDLTSLPDSISSEGSSTGTLVRSLEIDVPTTVATANATLRMTLSRADLDGADPRSLQVARWTGGEWQSLETSVVRVNASTVVLRSRTPGFSVFAVFATAAPPTTASPPPTTPGPDESGTDGMLPVFAIGVVLVAGLGGGVWWMRRDDEGDVSDTPATPGGGSSPGPSASGSGTGQSTSASDSSAPEPGTTGAGDGESPAGPAPSADGETPLATSLEEFEMIEKIGQGGNAEVYKARPPDAEDDEVVALKVPQMHEFRTVEADTFEEFIEEARTWNRVDGHEHIVSVLNWGETPHPWIAMEYMNAGSLREQDSLATEKAHETVLDIAGAMQYVHRYGITHGDLKPENVLFDERDGETVVKVTDWGLAKVLLEHSQSKEGMTPEYAAPEQFTDDPRDAEDYQLIDVYQLGAVAYEAFTGKPAFEGSPFEVMEMIKNEPPTPPSEVSESLPAELDEVILRAMSKEPGDRYPTVQQFIEALESIEY